MPGFHTLRPDRRERLDSFLRRRSGYQGYRIPILIGCRAVGLWRDSRYSVLTSSGTLVRPGDTVTIPDPLPAHCQQQFNNIPASRFRDYAFAPGESDYEREIRELISLRPQTQVVQPTLASTLVGFLKALRGSLVTHPIRDIIIASHARYPEGYLCIALDTEKPLEVTYDQLIKAQRQGTIRIPNEIITPRPRDQHGRPIPLTVHIRGCRVGVHIHYLHALKQALGGGALRVIAPKHLHWCARHRRPDGRIEYMSYAFVVFRPGPFPTGRWDQVIQAFRAQGFRLVNGTPVSPAQWHRWIPWRRKRWGPDPNRIIDWNTVVVNPLTNTRKALPAQFFYRIRDLFKQEQYWHFKADPGKDPLYGPKSDAAERRKRAVRDLLMREPSFRDRQFPEYVRWGYQSMDAFMDGWKWNIRWESKKSRLAFQATRHEYTVVHPIVNHRNELYLNFYPSPRSRNIRVPGRARLGEADPRFFAIVQ